MQEVDLNTIPKQVLSGGGGGDSKKKSNDEKVALCASMRNLHLHQEDEEMEIERDDEVQDVSSEGGNTSENDSNNVEQKLEDDIVEKLMNYAGGKFKPTIVHQDSMSLLDILPMEWADALQDIGMKNVSDISLDLGRRPYCWYNHQRKYLSEDASHVVNERDIHDAVASLQDPGDDNRAGINGQLHRISCIRNNSNGMIGLTIRVGRHIEGNSAMIRDLLEESDKSILLLGEPGSGKHGICYH